MPPRRSSSRASASAGRVQHPPVNDNDFVPATPDVDAEGAEALPELQAGEQVRGAPAPRAASPIVPRVSQEDVLKKQLIEVKSVIAQI